MSSASAPRWAVLVLVGALGGTLSGMFGVGGGILMVPLLVGLAGMDQRRAAATSLAAIVPTAIAASTGYLVRGHTDLTIGALVALGGVAGSWLGTWLLRRLPVTALRWMFVGLLLVVAVRLLTAAPVAGHPTDWTLASGLALVGVGLATGVSAGLFGVGGGVVVVPALILLLGVDELVAKGTSLLVIVPTSLVGTFANARARLVDLRDGALVGAAATVTSFLGVAVAFWIPDRLGNVLFAVLVLGSAGQLAWRAARSHRRTGGEASG